MVVVEAQAVCVVTQHDAKPGNVLLEAAAVAAGCVLVLGGAVALGALSLTAHLVARVVPPARPRRYVPVELRAMFGAR